MLRYWIGLIVVCWCILSCNNPQEVLTENPLFHLLSPEKTGIQFINKVEEQLDFNIITYRNFYNGGGVAVGDLNQDSLPDLYFTANQQKNKLYVNKGNMHFEDITEKAGVGGTKAWSTGVSMADVNGDGLLDIYVCNSGDIQGDNKENELFINQGNLTFIEKAKEYNLNNTGYSTHAAFFDYDRDGDLDCYILNNSFKDPAKIELYKSMRDTPDSLGGDKLMRNDISDGGHFTDVTSQAGIYSSVIGFGLGVATGDVNGDNLADLYISNDFFEKDYLYINNGNGTFKEDLQNRIDYCSTSSMGGDMADLNGDGSPEIFTTDMLPGDNDRIKRMVVFEPYHLEDYKYRANYYYQFTQNCLHLNDGTGHFQEIGFMTGIAATDWSWGAMIFDFQNDGTNDVFVSNGIYKDLMEGDFRDFVYDDNNKKAGMGHKNLGISNQLPSTALQNYAFVNKGNLSLINEAESLGLKEKTFSNGSVYADLDRDGDLDLVLNNVNQPSMIYENHSNSNGNTYLRLDFDGPPGNKYGIGVKVNLKTSTQLFCKENFTNRGFQSSIEPNLFFGLGTNKIINVVEVIWPDGKIERLKNIGTNQSLTIKYINAIAATSTEKQIAAKVFTALDGSMIPREAMHHENTYNDFNQEPLLLSMHSTQGPKILKADVNRDGLEDLFLLGARNDPDKMLMQQTNGKFILSNKTIFEKDKGFESTCGGFLDFENDGDLDLLVGSGGNEIAVDKINFIVRLYINDGKGNFTVDPVRIPPVLGNFSTIQATDINNDGFQDVFIGAKSVPGNYGLIPASFLLINDLGTWKDITTPSLKKIGMVTDACWADVNGDTWPDLIVVGEWMSIQVLLNNQGVLGTPMVIKGTSGWWQRIAAADLDGDGDTDFVVGNWGLNSKLQADRKNPLTMHVADFDSNGKSEFIINWKPPLDTQNYPICTKAELTTQIPSLRKTELKYIDFAPMTFEKLFPNFPKENLMTYSVENLSSGVLWNENGTLQFEALPMQAQVSPVMAISIHDFNSDGKKDIVLGGNFYALKPQMGRMAAGRGLLLTGQDHHQFSPSLTAGLNLKSEVRDILIIKDKLIVASNNGPLGVYTY